MVKVRPRRRGVLLLIVLSLLVLFALLGLTFIVSAGQFKRTSAADARIDQTGMPSSKLLNSALYQLLRDTDNPGSSVRGHSLLGDLYGYDFAVGRVMDGAHSWSNNNQLHELTFEWDSSPSSDLRPEERNTDHYFGGCVLTFLSGPAAGKSARIVSYAPSEGNKLRILATSPAAPAGSRFLINGRPFNGTGTGYNSASGKIDDTASMLLPHYRMLTPSDFSTKVASGGFDESWDGVDVQNYFLAKVPPDPDTNPESDVAPDAFTYLQNTGGIQPSYHQPYLLRYLKENLPQVLDSDLRRRVLLRPDRYDHPAFSGSNPKYDANRPWEGPWDVDNDGDGTADSVWIDFGLEPVVGPDGRMYKPLIAPLIVDMDGRANLNAVGSLEQLKAASRSKLPVTPFDALGVNFDFLSATSSMFGLGFGPADINPTIFSELDRFRIYRGRYQGISETVVTNSNPPFPLQHEEKSVPGQGPPSASSNSLLAISLTSDDDVVRGKVIPPLYWPYQVLGQGNISGDQNPWEGGDIQTSLDYGYGSPADLFARSFPFVDSYGNLVWHGTGVLDGLDDPYESNPLLGTANDAPFRFMESELLQRMDEQREPSRIRSLSNIISIPARRRATAHSVHIPVPIPVVVTTSTEGNRLLVRSITDLFILKCQDHASDPRKKGTSLVPRELQRGEKLNLNRLFRRAPSDISIEEKVEFARDLFHLMMVLADDPFHNLFPANVTEENGGQRRRELHIQRLAQWSINVVDFADSDSAMTPFVYDVNPFNDDVLSDYDYTNPNNDQSPDRRMVWGCEHPELLITETLATHDRRVADTPTGGTRFDSTTKTVKNEADGGDDELDQVLPPLGTLFVELFACRGPKPKGKGIAATHGPEDLFTNMRQINLSQVAPGNTPVWRILIGERQAIGSPAANSMLTRAASANGTRADETSFEPEYLSRFASNSGLVSSPEQLAGTREIWFSSIQPAGDQRWNTFTPQGVGPLLLEPGRFAIIGPQPQTYLRVDPDTLQGTGELIDLTNPRNSTDVSGTKRFPQETLDALPIVVQNPRGIGCSISEPIDRVNEVYPSDDVNHWIHYPDIKDQPSAQRTSEPADDFTYPLDLPEDMQNPLSPANSHLAHEEAPLWAPKGSESVEGLQVTGVRVDYRTVFLQRLANPRQAWDPIRNPYRTIDWMPVDLSVYNSLQKKEDLSSDSLPLDPQDPLVDEKLPDIQIRSRRRGRADRLSLNLWSSESSHDFRLLGHTLGWLNDTFSLKIAPGTTAPQRIDERLTPLRSQQEQEEEPFPPEKAITFPGLVWNNRPYANEYELLLVPAVSQARLSAEFTGSQDPATITNAADEYRGPFGHLLNFFHKSPEGSPAAGYHRLFDFVTVPSRFHGTSTPSGQANDPFLSNFREPGRLNLNTIVDWSGLGLPFSASDEMSLSLSHGLIDRETLSAGPPARSRLVKKRSTYPDGKFPAEFSNPFRASPQIPGSDPIGGSLLRNSVEHKKERQPLLAKYSLQPIDPEFDDQPPPPIDFDIPYRSRQANSFFRFRDIIKVGGSATSQSNVYAVWLTVGYFEIEPNYVNGDFSKPYAIDDAHPDGYRFGVEMGSDVGNIRRHRAFYLIDRSIPVAFEPGKNHNVDEAILIRRQLE